MENSDLSMLLNNELADTRERALTQLQEALKEKNYPRHDYKEILVLPYLFLGGQQYEEYVMRDPG